MIYLTYKYFPMAQHICAWSCSLTEFHINIDTMCHRTSFAIYFDKCFLGPTCVIAKTNYIFFGNIHAGKLKAFPPNIFIKQFSFVNIHIMV